MTSRFVFLGLLVCFVITSGCASKQYQFAYHAEETTQVWPQPPDEPRYRFVGFIAGEGNFVVDENSLNAFNRSIDWLRKALLGESPPRGLYRPQGILVDSQLNRIYVTDIGQKAVFVFDRQANELLVWEQVDELEKFSAPIGVAINNNNEVFVSDSTLGFVVKLSQEGKPLAKLGEKLLQRPTGLAFDRQNNNLYVADAALHKVFVFSDKGELAFQIGGRKGDQTGLFNSPTYLAIANQKLHVSDTLNARIQQFSLQGDWLGSFGKRGMYKGNLPRPKGVAVDSENHVYVVESYYDHLLIFNEQGVPLLPIGGHGNKPGQFNLPAGIWIDEQDQVYVVDMFNSRVSVFQYLKQTN